MSSNTLRRESLNSRAPLCCSWGPPCCGWAPPCCGWAPPCCNWAPPCCNWAPPCCGWARAHLLGKQRAFAHICLQRLSIRVPTVWASVLHKHCMVVRGGGQRACCALPFGSGAACVCTCICSSVLKSSTKRPHVGWAGHTTQRGAMYRHHSARPPVLDHKQQPNDGPIWPGGFGAAEERMRSLPAAYGLLQALWGHASSGSRRACRFLSGLRIHRFRYL